MHAGEEQLILIYYGEAEEDPHVRECAQCQAELRRLAGTLDHLTTIPVPEPTVDLVEHATSFLPRPQARPGNNVLAWRRIAIPAAIAASLIAAFEMGRPNPVEQVAERRPILSAPAIEELRASVLEAGLSDHLERSGRVLAEISNAPEAAVHDISLERRLAEDLVVGGRFYRQSAVQAGDSRYAELLDDLERLLTELAHAPEKLTPERLREFRERIEDQQILFRLRTVKNELREDSL